MSSDFKTRLYHLEIAPPLNVWDKITIALDDIALAEGLSSKLYELEVVPPASVWQKISSVLDRQNREMMVPFLERIRPYYRYAAAAVIIGLITFAISLLTSKQNIANVAREETLQSTRQAPPAIQKDNQITNRDNHIAASLTAQNKKRMISASFSRAGKSVEEILLQKLMNSPNHYNTPAVLQTNFSTDELENNSSQLNYPARSYSDGPLKTNQVNRYMMLLRPDGYIIRMPKKISTMLNCMYSVSGIEEDYNCRDQLKIWREKIAKSSVNPSPDNFMDILTLIKSLEEN